jgi:hypothetical protein
VGVRFAVFWGVCFLSVTSPRHHTPQYILDPVQVPLVFRVDAVYG